MRLSSKIKYAAAGAVSAVVLVPLIVKAVDTIPLTFQEGDVISANVINTLLSRVNDVQKGFSSVADLDGNWSCTIYDTGSAFGTDYCAADGALVRSKTGTLSFNASAKTWSWSGPGSLNDCGSGGATSGNYDVKAGVLLTDLGVYDTRRRGPNEFIWFITNSMPASGFNKCIKVAIPPSPADGLTARVTGKRVALTWTDQSSDETGFKVERKTSSTGAWTLVDTTNANATSYNDSGVTSGTYWYRVIATNSYGDAISSSEVQAVVE